MVNTVHHLVGSAEIAQLLGVGRQRVQQLISRPDFPAPEVVLAMGKVWSRDDVIAWAKADGRLADEPGGTNGTTTEPHGGEPARIERDEQGRETAR